MSEDSKSMIVKLRLPVNLVKSLERVARRRGVRRSRLVASVLADWVEDYVERRFEPFTIRRDRINIIDNILGKIIPVSIIRGELYCEYCKSFTCGHTRYAKKLYAKHRPILRFFDEDYP